MYYMIAKNKIEAKIARVTPETAKLWLGVNPKNRNIRKLVVGMYARDMAAGNWLVTGEAIKFNTVGNIIDGQHRLAAIVESGATVEMMIITGLDDSAQAVLDTGAKRTAFDVLSLDGYSNGTTLASAARLCLTLESGGMDTRNKARSQSKSYTHTEITNYIKDHDELVEAAARAGSLKSQLDITPSVICVAVARLGQIDPDACREFFDSMASMNTTGSGDPRATLVKRLASARRNGEKLPQGVQLAFIYRAWNAWRKGETLTILRTTTNGKALSIPTPV